MDKVKTWIMNNRIASAVIAVLLVAILISLF